FTKINPNNSQDIRIRGLGTIYSDSTPLIVVDGFPYEDDILNINPEIIESISILKDAAAASIWGARAGNGVIVITTKNNNFQTGSNISLRVNTKITEQPNL